MHRKPQAQSTRLHPLTPQQNVTPGHPLGLGVHAVGVAYSWKTDLGKRPEQGLESRVRAPWKKNPWVPGLRRGLEGVLLVPQQGLGQH